MAKALPSFSHDESQCGVKRARKNRMYLQNPTTKEPRNQECVNIGQLMFADFVKFRGHLPPTTPNSLRAGRVNLIRSSSEGLGSKRAALLSSKSRRKSGIQTEPNIGLRTDGCCWETAKGDEKATDLQTSNKCIASSNKCHASSNRCLTSSNKKLLNLL